MEDSLADLCGTWRVPVEVERVGHHGIVGA